MDIARYIIVMASIHFSNIYLYSDVVYLSWPLFPAIRGVGDFIASSEMPSVNSVGDEDWKHLSKIKKAALIETAPRSLTFLTP